MVVLVVVKFKPCTNHETAPITLDHTFRSMVR